jgi:ABC-2 type transport system permease protein
VNSDVFTLTLREFLGQRRSLLIFLLAAVPVGLAIIVRVSQPDDVDRLDWIANTLMDGTVITTILPLTCLLLGTAAFGNEIDGGTIFYLLTKPIRRSEIVLAKFVAAATLAGVFLTAATLTSGLIAIKDKADVEVALAFAIAVALGTMSYTAIFLLLSLVTSRALLIGLAYILVWEAIVTELFSAASYLSVRQYCLGIADLLWDTEGGIFEADTAGVAALVLAIALTLGALVVAVRSLERLQVREPD